MLWRILLYNLIIVLAVMVTLPGVIYQLLFVGKRRRGIAQRFGAAPSAGGKTVWVHAVSVGEVRAVSPMLWLLEEDDRARGRVFLSTVTPTGQDTARKECSFAASIFFFPLDLPLVIGRALDRVRPEIFITAETEIWPNFFAACFRRRIPVVVVNGRISDHSFSRYVRFSWFFSPILKKVDLFLMQSEEDASRIIRIGARPGSVEVTGNTKYDRLPLHVPIPEAVRAWARKGFLLVAGSTHNGEESILLDLLKAQGEGDLRLALVPRHPERFDEVASLLRRRGVPFTRYSETASGGEPSGNVLLVDAMGVLDGFYEMGDLAFVGGSLVPVGGHNLLEPAMHGVPVLTGPHVQNFRDIAALLIEKGGCTVVEDADSLSRAVRDLRNRPADLKEMGASAKGASSEATGASGRNVARILRLMENMD
ncbi:MAG: 3-deoxy-D-manno-octulosonic acid transferase [bacterium]|nr:MAG: 3-deoxy-D-manno-octulosonic acid transferase [bacterium]